MANPTRITTADVDPNGRVDLLAHTWDDDGRTNRIALHAAQLGGWNPAMNIDIPAFDGWLGDVKAADLNGDGNVKIAAINRSLENSRIEFFGNNGSLSLTRQHVGKGAAQSLVSLETADSNGDGFLMGLACGSTNSSGLTRRSAGTALGPAAPTCIAMDAAEAIQVGDLNGEGLMDLLTGRPAVGGPVLTAGGFSIRPGSVFGGFGILQQIMFLFGPMTPQYRSTRIGDLSHDGTADHFFFDTQTGILTSPGNPNSPGTIPFVPFVHSAPGSDAAFLDFDADRDLDAVVAHANGATATRMTQRPDASVTDESAARRRVRCGRLAGRPL
ncbi:MAG: hypothetical protein JNJ88_06795 [Planctomycetes bacterium]|nr:hypothetical protein [Planctomycetota bacterium]